jgi:hypothetical protein
MFLRDDDERIKNNIENFYQRQPENERGYSESVAGEQNDIE